MNTQEIVKTIKSLPITINSRTDAAIAAIELTATKISEMMVTKGLQISKGGTSPSTNRSYARIYLERGHNSHNSRNSDYKELVVAEWEWQVKSKYGFSTISPKAIISFCKSLEEEVENA